MKKKLQLQEIEWREKLGRQTLTNTSSILTITLYCPVRLGGSHSSWFSDTVTEQGVSPISTV